MRTMPFAALLTAGLMAGAGAAGAQQGDAAAGEKAFGKCKACHTVEAGKNRVGPSLRGVVGRKSGTVEGFKYSDAMKNAAIEWTPENLDKYLADPKGFVPGNKMVFAGIKDPAERANVIAYLQSQGGASTGASAPPDASQRQASPLPGSGPGVGAATGQVAQGPSDAPASGSAVPAQGSPQIAAGDGAGDQVSALPALSAPLKGADGKDLGTVTLTGAEGGVVLEIQASGLKPGEHGFHVHETGACQGDFKSAGGHFNPAGTTHGVLGGKAHAGDLPNLHVPADGKVVAEFFVQGVSLQGGQNALMDQNGAAVVVHAGPDDYRTDPAGNSGDRIACAAFAAAK